MGKHITRRFSKVLRTGCFCRRTTCLSRYAANKLKSIGIVFLLSLNLFGGTLVYAVGLPAAEELYDVLIIGSAEHPDPVLEKVRILENKGVLKNVIVMESFPVQIRVTGPRAIIEVIQKMPRKISPNFK